MPFYFFCHEAAQFILLYNVISKVVGPMANNVNQLYGNYAADVDSRYVKTPYEGLKMMATTVNYAAGCPDNKCKNYTASDVTKAIKGTQLVVICVGTGISFTMLID